ncbi:peptidoglycan/LPS O-acetylase OafA/YrhL [Nitrosomonas sp. Nm84]|uniref:acyltransferase family protein n=1 Tax=Nitrosomonas sp. Nm84 TaxID=200124 RepID=UPI000D764D94|nr:acyltransferase [Nitrosomonas sp. Nm84]PXW89636.1 peptidoglycan/LPS O-acetylase OafA/YrhL [Nitrosomonas sp. Nm84]
MIHISRKKEIRSHTSLRGLAALIVVFVHFRSFFHSSIDPDEFTFFLYKGYLWVDFFFILSGFVMAYVYDIEHPKRYSMRDTMHYLIARIARIYPLHLISLVATLLFFIMVAFINWGLGEEPCCGFDDSLRNVESLIANLFLIHAWGIFDWVTWNFPSWSLSAEFFCYLIFAVLLTINGDNRKLALVALSCTAVLFYCLCIATSSDVDENFRLSTIRAASAFTIGMMLFLGREAVSAVSERSLTCIQIAACIALFFSLHFGVTDILSIGLMALIVLVTWEDRGYLCNCLDTRYVHTIGLLSFSIYMWHYLIKFIAKQDWESFTGLPVQSSVMGSVLFVVCMIGLVIPIAVGSYRHLEIPARQWISLRLNGLLETKYSKYSPNWQLALISSERKR